MRVDRNQRVPSYAVLARRQQADFRNSSSTISEAARRPTDEKGGRHGHLLALGYEPENLYPPLRVAGRALQFFDERGIKWWRSASSGDMPGNGPTRNLASSQVGCVNFLMPLNGSPDQLLAILRILDNDVTNVVPMSYTTGRGAPVTTFVDFEWVGLTTSLENTRPTRGVNCTSADAIILASTPSTVRAYLFEFKYVEQYRADEFLGHGDKGRTRRERYQPLYEANDSPFNGGVPLEALLYDPVYQLMRLFLLGSKMVREHELGVSDFRVVVVCPEENREYRNRITSPELRKCFPGASSCCDAFAGTLERTHCLRVTSVADLLQRLTTSGSLTEWRQYHRERYSW